MPASAPDPLDQHPPAAPSRSLTVPVAAAVALALGGHLLASAAPERPARRPAPVAARTTVTAPGLDVVPRQAAAPARVAKPKPSRASRGTARKPAVKPKPKPKPKFVRPASAGLTSHFGPRWGRMHKGLDFGTPYGTPIRAVADGVVVSAGQLGAYGTIVVIRHTRVTSTAYAHLSRIAVKRGRVKAGQVIAYSGNSGRSTGPHLHFEVRVGGTRVNPIPWLRKHGIRV